MDGSWGPGRLIAGRYRLVSQLGEGGMGAVWRADHLTLNSPVAIKLIDPTISGTQGAIERFEREAQASASLRSPHVVQIFDYGIDEGVPYIAMEMLEGESLADRLARSPVLPYAQTAKFVAHVGRALSKAHEAGIIHRDLKPENVFLVRNEDDEMAKVLDFGIAKLTAQPLGAPSGGKTKTGTLLGTPSYMSPEQAQGIKTIDWRSDLWSLAVIAFECVCGRTPFQSEALGDLLVKICVHPIPIPSQVAQVPPGFDAWFARAANRDPGLRYQSAKELADALRAVLAPDGLERSSIGIYGISSAPPMLSGGAAAAATVQLPGSFAPPSSGPAARPNTVAGVSISHPSPGRGRTALWIGLGALGLGAIGTAAAWFGFVRGAPPVSSVAAEQSTLTAAATAPPAVTVTAAPAVTTVATVSPQPSVSAAPAPPASTPAPTRRVQKPAAASSSSSSPPAALPPLPRPTVKPGDQRIGF
jgi:serine/threonine-protein kinase